MAESAGERIVREWYATHGEIRTVNAASMPDLARRIDAALAEARARFDIALSAHTEARTLLAEREVMVAALREALLVDFYGWTRDGHPCWCATDTGFHATSCVQRCSAYLNTADAAARCLARARQEGAEEMREKAAQMIETLEHEQSGTWGVRHLLPAERLSIATAIRALVAGAPAVRRG